MLALVSVDNCQTNTAEESAPASSETLEEFVIYVERSLFRLRQKLYTAEEDFFEIFNALNSNDEFEVGCDYVISIGAHRRLRQCKAEFLIGYERDLASGWITKLSRLRRKEKQ